MMTKDNSSIKLRDLPLSALRAFAAAAQWQTLAGAADQLGVTHGAISRQIHKLEAWVGQDLFVRQGRQLALTPTGKLFATKVDQILGELVSACMEVSGARRRQVVVVEAPTSFAMYWLLPRLTGLEAEVRATEVSVATRMTNQSYDGPLGEVVITRGPGLDRRLHGYRRDELITERMALMAAPSFPGARKIRRPKDVLDFQMVGSVTRPTYWPNWMHAAGLEGEQPRFRHRFDHLFVALHAVRDGIGSIVAPFNIFNGVGAGHTFCVILEDIQFTGETYYIYYREDSNKGVLRPVIEYLLDSAS